MRHNDSFRALALRLMEHRLQELRKQSSGTEEDLALAAELAKWTETKHARVCDECCGVGMVRFAYTGILGSKSYVIARADEDQPGHCAQPAFGEFPTLQKAQDRADALNEANGLDKKAAYAIVISSIRAENVRERAADARRKR